MGAWGFHSGRIQAVGVVDVMSKASVHAQEKMTRASSVYVHNNKAVIPQKERGIPMKK